MGVPILGGWGGGLTTWEKFPRKVVFCSGVPPLVEFWDFEFLCFNLNVGVGTMSPETDFTLKNVEKCPFIYACTTRGPLDPGPSC